MTVLVWAHDHLDHLFPESLRTIIADTALFLILGGLALIALIVTLVLLRGLFPASPPNSRGREDGTTRTLRPLPPNTRHDAEGMPHLPVDPGDADAGWQHARRIGTHDLEGALDHVVAQGLGEPRLLRVRPDHAVIRLYACAAHVPPPPASAPHGGCAYARGFLQGVLQEVWGDRLRVQETRCGDTASRTCDFDIRFSGGA